MKKGDCFDVAGRLMMKDPHFVLVHAKVSGQGKLKGRKIDHAWIEINNWVLDFSNGHSLGCKKEKYYKIARPIDLKRYNKTEAFKLMLKTGHFGPWNSGGKT